MRTSLYLNKAFLFSYLLFKRIQRLQEKNMQVTQLIIFFTEMFFFVMKLTIKNKIIKSR